MNETNTIVARRQTDGTLVQVLDNGSLRPSEDTMDWDRFRNMTDDEILAAAMSDPDALPTPEDRPAAPRVPRAQTLRRRCP